jgi:hypothetical protein
LAVASDSTASSAVASPANSPPMAMATIAPVAVPAAAIATN